MTVEEQVDIWLRQAQHDLAGAEAAQQAGFYDHCAVLCEQAAEKFLKALWMWRQRAAAPEHIGSIGFPNNLMRLLVLFERHVT